MVESDDKNKIDHAKRVQDQKIENALRDAARLCVDIELIAKQNFSSNLDEYDLKILKRCKSQLSVIFKELDLYNLSLVFEPIESFKNGEIANLNSLPNTELLFKPRDRQNPDEGQHLIDLDNKRVLDCVKRLESLMESTRLQATYKSIRKFYASNTDGVIISLNIPDGLTIDKVSEILDEFDEDVQNLSIEELLIAQQFSDLYTIEFANPFWLGDQASIMESKIKISTFNIHQYTPMYSLSVIIQSLRQKLKIISSKNDYVDLIHVFEKSPSLNDSCVFINIKFYRG